MLVAKASDADAGRSGAAANTSNCSEQSQQPSAFSSIEGITLTPPATPSPAKLAQLFGTDDGSSKRALAAATSARSTCSAGISSSAATLASCSASGRRRSHSLSYAETVLHRADDPFDIDWSLWTNANATASVGRERKQEEQPQQQQPPKRKKNTNPFLPSSPDTPENTESSLFEREI